MDTTWLIVVAAWLKCIGVRSTDVSPGIAFVKLFGVIRLCEFPVVLKTRLCVPVSCGIMDRSSGK